MPDDAYDALRTYARALKDQHGMSYSELYERLSEAGYSWSEVYVRHVMTDQPGKTSRPVLQAVVDVLTDEGTMKA
jgi:hypothetical protein